MSGYTFRSTDIGVVHDLMIHDIDLVNSMFPGNLVDVRAIGISVFGKNEDIAQAGLQFRYRRCRQYHFVPLQFCAQAESANFWHRRIRKS